MTTKLEFLTKIPFDEVTGTTRGVVLKAGLQSSAATEAGIGLGGAVGGGTWTYTGGGLKKTSLDYNGIDITLSAVQAATVLGSRGTIQFEVLRSDIANVLATAQGKKIIDLYDGSANAVYLNVQSVAQGGAGYRQFTDMKGGTAVYTNAIGIGCGSGFSNSDVQVGVFHEETPVDADGFITLAVTWEGAYYWYYIDGVPVAKGRRKNPSALNQATTCKLRLFNDNWPIGTTPTIRNLVVTGVPLYNPMKAPGAYRVQLLMHSFGQTYNGNMEYVGDGVTNYWDASSATGGNYVFGAKESITPTILQNTSNPVKIINTSYPGKDTAWMKTQVDGTADTTQRCYRYRPHFLIIGGHINNAGTPAVDIAAMALSCFNRGVVPIFLREMNGDLGNTPVDHSGAGGIAELFDTAVLAARTAYGDVGYADQWSVAGGATVTRSLVENNATGIHPNINGTKQIGELLAAEINRLIANPPAYAWWR